MHRRDLFRAGLGIGVFSSGPWGVSPKQGAGAEVEPFHIFATGESESLVVDPSAFENDASALQRAVDHVLTEWGGRGTVYYPAAKRDGTSLSITNTIHIGPRDPTTQPRASVNVVPRHPNAWFDVRIDDGRPAFVMYASNHNEVELNLRSKGILNFTGFVIGGGTLFNSIRVRADSYSGTALVVDSGAFGQDIGLISRAHNQYLDSTATAVALRFQDRIPDYSPPGNSDVYIASDTQHRSCVEFAASRCSRVTIGGHLEGASGEAGIDCGTDNDVVVRDGTDVTGFEDAPFTYGIRCSGNRAKLRIGAVRFSRPAPGGACVRCEGGDRWAASQILVDPSVLWPITVEDLISIVDKPVAGQGWSVVPRPEFLNNQVAYPGNRRRLRHYDGSFRIRSGATQLGPGGTQIEFVDSLQPERSYSVSYSVDPQRTTGPVEIDDAFRYDPGDQSVRLQLRETFGESTALVRWEVYAREQLRG